MRLEYLKDSGQPERDWTCLEHSQARKKLGFFRQDRVSDENEIDTSELVICDYIDNGQRVEEDETEEDNE